MFYSKENEDMAKKLTGSDVTYSDLITSDDRDFWDYLVKKDFKRLEKLLTQSMGEGNFMDDTSDEEEPMSGDFTKIESSPA